jgi:elongation factor P--(R)-beta-lysine ligase
VTHLLLRNKAIRAARGFFASQGILEVLTPKAVTSPALEPYIDAVSVIGQENTGKMFLATSPEFALKKIFAAEMAVHKNARGIYEIAPAFRDDRTGKNHAMEFTMVEWYLKDSSLHNILESAANLINTIADTADAKPIPAAFEILDMEQMFRDAGHPFDLRSEAGAVQKYQSLHKSLPQHLNETDAAIICFNLLFDEIILPRIRSVDGLVAVSGYPEYLGALAYTENGIAARAEIYFRGLELANGYREEYRRDVAENRWQRYNEIRNLRGVLPHTIDAELLQALPAMDGVSGIALGLERILACLNPGADVSAFLQPNPSSSFLP